MCDRWHALRLRFSVISGPLSEAKHHHKRSAYDNDDRGHLIWPEANWIDGRKDDLNQKHKSDPGNNCAPKTDSDCPDFVRLHLFHCKAPVSYPT